MSSSAVPNGAACARFVVAGVAMFFAGAGMEHVLSYANDSRIAWLLQHLAIGTLVACLIAFYEHRNRKMVLLMNHHVRNALQVIVYGLHGSGRSDKVAMQAVARIEWALRDVLTGQTTAQGDGEVLAPPGHQPQVPGKH